MDEEEDLEEVKKKKMTTTKKYKQQCESFSLDQLDLIRQMYPMATAP